MARASRLEFAKCGMDTQLSFNIKSNQKSLLLPIISAQTFNSKGGFDGETIISRAADGSIVSRFKDRSWDFSGLADVASRNAIMYFDHDEKLADEVKTLINLVMITPTKTQFSIDRCFVFYSLLKRIAQFSISEEATVKSLFNTKGGVRLVKLFQDEVPYSAETLATISECLKFMSLQGEFEHGYKSLSRGTLSQLNKITRAYTQGIKQSPVVPSRILKTIYIDTISEYECLQPVLNELIKMQSEIELHPMIGIASSSQKTRCQDFCGTSFGLLDVTYPTNYDLGGKYPLARDYLNNHFSSDKNTLQVDEFEFDVKYDRSAVLHAINYIQRVCQDMIILFTGMRSIEARLLPYFGSKETIVDGVKYWLIYGFAAKKRTDTPPFEMWVTNEYGYKAFQTAKRIADLHYRRNQRAPVETIPDGEFTPELSPLFLRDGGEIDKRNYSNLKTPALKNSYLMTQEDMDELKMIDPHRSWDGDPDYVVGNPFPFELRLVRRSVAFFASASGVRVVDLKNQLHHLFDSQTFYYCSGSGRANPFLKNRDSFASFFNQVKHEAEAFSFITEVINFDGKLLGVSAEYAERNDWYHTTIRGEERSETIMRIKRGEFAYTQTHVGGCKTVTPCKLRALGSLTACLSCKDAVIKPVKLTNAIKDQAQLVDGLNPDRLEFRTEIEELFIMLDYAIKNIGNAMKKLDRRKNEYKQFSQWFKEFKQMKKGYLKKLGKSGRAA